MADKRLQYTETATTTHELSYPLSDLVLFVHYLIETNKVTKQCDDAMIVAAARSYWDRQHGDDD